MIIKGEIAMKYMYQGKEIYPSVEIYPDVIPYIGGITDHQFYTDPELCIQAWRKSKAAIAEYFGDYAQALTLTKAPTAPGLSYGHLVCLGAPLKLPAVDGEPNVVPFASDIDEAIEIMKAKKNVDFGDNDVFRYYVEMNKALQKAFPEYDIPLTSGYGYEGVITSAVLMRGQDFLCDIYDEPEKAHEFLTLMNESIIEFKKFICRFNGQPERSRYMWLCDDFASLITPSLWPEFVVPYWNQYFDNLSVPGSRRTVHCENTHPTQLRYLKDVGLAHYQPSVATALTLENVKENTDVPFDWLLYAFNVVKMTDEEIEAWVDKTVEAGVRKVRTQFGRYAWRDGKMDRILAFYQAFEKYRAK
jgi:hypothetical protein